ncbi:hypothetical protein D3C77_484320 [compost metagenome]
MPINRLLLHLIIIAVDYLLAVKPDLVISIRLRIKMVTYFASPVVNFGMNLRLIRVRVTHDVTVNIAASCECA